MKTKSTVARLHDLAIGGVASWGSPLDDSEELEGRKRAEGGDQAHVDRSLHGSHRYDVDRAEIEALGRC